MVDVTRREPLEEQSGTVLELFHAFGGLYTTLGSVIATDVAEGTNPVVAEGKEDEVVPYASMHDIAELTPSS